MVNGTTLTVTEGTTSESFTLAGSHPSIYYAHDDGHGGTLIDDSQLVCFASGTAIRTARGDVAVEHLAVGDLVVTSAGTHRPIRWLGHRTVDCRRDPLATRPVRIAAHAFGPNRPVRDVLVSPGHAICVDVAGEVLIPAGSLTNGSTIAQVEVDAVTYWHVELDSHDVLLADNLAAESYLDMGNRGFFAESDAVTLAAMPDVVGAKRAHADFCRPFHAGGPIVEAVGRRLRRAIDLAATSPAVARRVVSR